MDEVTNFKQSPDQNAQTVIRWLLDGNPPGDIAPEECGRWAPLISDLNRAHANGGTQAVQAALLSATGDDESLITLLATDVLDLDSSGDDMNGEDQGVHVLPSGAKIIDWASMKKMFGLITWAWLNWLANGFLTMIVGQPDAGKSLVTLIGVCKPFLTGSPWPDGTPFEGKMGRVLWIEGESGQLLNLARAEEFGLPMHQIISIGVGDEIDLQIDNPQHWKAIVEAAQLDDIVFIVFDGLSGLQSQEENSSAMMSVVKKLAVLARTLKIPIAVLHHLNKLAVPDGEIPTIRHIRGHSSIAQTPRVVWSVDMPNRHDKKVKRLAMLKNNAGGSADPITYQVIDNEIRLTSPSQPVRRTTKQETAAQFLLKELADGPVPSARIENMLESQDLLDAAKKVKPEIGIVSEMIDGVWHWKLVGSS